MSRRTAALPLHVRIAEGLIREIAAGRLSAGTRLPPEREMAKAEGVSVGTLRKALAILSDKGLLARRQGSGNYVSEKRGAEGVYALFRIELIGGGGLPTAALISLDLTDKPPDGPGFGDGPRAWRIRRLRRLSGAPAVLEEIWLDEAAAPGGLSADDLSESLYLHYRTRLGLSVARAEDAVGVASAPDWAPPGFGPVAGAPCGFVERLTWAGPVAPVEYSRNWFDPEIARYIARLS